MRKQSVSVENTPIVFDERSVLLAEAYVALCRLTDEEVEVVMRLWKSAN